MKTKGQQVKKRREEQFYARYKEIYAGTSQAFWDGFMKIKKADVEACPALDPIDVGISIRREKFSPFEKAFLHKPEIQDYYQQASTIECGVVSDDQVDAFALALRTKDLQPSVEQEQNFVKFKQTLQKRKQERDKPRFSLSPMKRELMAEKSAIASLKQSIEDPMMSAFPAKSGKATSMNENSKRRGKEYPSPGRRHPASISLSNAKKSLFRANLSKTPGSRSRKLQRGGGGLGPDIKKRWSLLVCTDVRRNLRFAESRLLKISFPVISCKRGVKKK